MVVKLVQLLELSYDLVLQLTLLLELTGIGDELLSLILFLL